MQKYLVYIRAKFGLQIRVDGWCKGRGLKSPSSWCLRIYRLVLVLRVARWCKDCRLKPVF